MPSSESRACACASFLPAKRLLRSSTSSHAREVAAAAQLTDGVTGGRRTRHSSKQTVLSAHTNLDVGRELGGPLGGNVWYATRKLDVQKLSCRCHGRVVMQLVPMQGTQFYVIRRKKTKKPLTGSSRTEPGGIRGCSGLRVCSNKSSTALVRFPHLTSDLLASQASQFVCQEQVVQAGLPSSGDAHFEARHNVWILGKSGTDWPSLYSDQPQA
ncbi:uncharacterized protein LY79DRAFT_655189 [Colletotrichum navitas]|uniref:Uncharacterized protein n=1 Tax=Colletotrichum navitas TaxID=681940 RepID=A0AAD8QBL9_9PEZI|nr:uncharacterized protein LY79DRAFT_655189 [Colletotrichum navitas]KAK1599410.1 hypothetical protein LY79DRAFT_655189 [Colletotrichum navitas]